MQEFIDALKSGDVAAAGAVLDAHPSLLTGRSPSGASWLAMAIYHGQTAIARLFLDRGAQPDFFEAAMLGDTARVARFLDGGQAIDALAPDGFPALSLAVFFGHPDTFRLLLDRGASVHLIAANAMQVAPIHAAAARRDSASVEALLARGADPNVRQAHDYTALHTAAGNGDQAMVDILLAAGADTSLRSSSGQTAADLAEERGHGSLSDKLRAKY